ncbi:MAG: hypothetical protein K2H06_04090 [Anaeroplasmataceae bacterium]|nr:hypothetical protein [Anaeroplasmataceae bacterium]
MEKIRVLLALLIVLMLSSCKIESKIKNDFFSEATLQKYELEALPKGNWKDCVVWGSSLYFNIEREEFENWILSVVGYIDSREYITCWGFAEQFHSSGSRDYPVTLYESSNDYLKEHNCIAIAFTTMPLEDNTFQNCYYIQAYSGYDATLDVKGESYHYGYYMSLQDKSSYANKYHIA